MHKDKKFLEFFFKRLKRNTTDHYSEDFPYISPCGREMNYIRCEDLPIVFNQLLKEDGQVIQDISAYGNNSTTPSNEFLSYGGTDGLTVPFQPQKLVMLPTSGRIYHVGPVDGVGLIKSSLAIELSRFFIYDPSSSSEYDSPKEFYWKGQSHLLDNTVLESLSFLNSIHSS